MRRLARLLAACCLGAAAAAGCVPSPAAAEPAGAWVSPLGDPPQLIRPFRPPAVRWGAGHRGVDLAGSPGAWVRAAGAGRVAFAGPLAGRGVVVVTHGALRTTYEPVATDVRVGDLVTVGDRIGRLAAGHDPARPGAGVLHWGLLRGEVYLDPMSLLGGRPVRLLPRWRPPPAPPGTDLRAPGAVVPVEVPPAPGRPSQPPGPPVATALTLLAMTGAAAALARAGPAT